MKITKRWIKLILFMGWFMYVGDCAVSFMLYSDNVIKMLTVMFAAGVTITMMISFDIRVLIDIERVNSEELPRISSTMSICNVIIMLARICVYTVGIYFLQSTTLFVIFAFALAYQCVMIILYGINMNVILAYIRSTPQYTTIHV